MDCISYCFQFNDNQKSVPPEVAQRHPDRPRGRSAHPLLQLQSELPVFLQPWRRSSIEPHPTRSAPAYVRREQRARRTRVVRARHAHEAQPIHRHWH